jgi:RNA-directed DNA polymerase
MNPGNAGGAKGGRKADASNEGSCEASSPSVPATDKQGEEDLWQRYGAERGVWSEKMLAALHESRVEGKKWFSLIDKVCEVKTLRLAWDQVLSNAGACGVDGVSVGRFAKDSQTRLLAVREHLKAGTYQPQPVKRVWIPKAGSARGRPLGIPTVRDRVVQSALKMVIEPIFERDFAPHSYGFRHGRGCKEALRRVDELLQSGLVHVVDVDIQGYFDSIPHERLMSLVRERIADGRVLGLLESLLKQGVLEQGVQMQDEPVKEGTPQGGVISPLLANVYLNPLDWLMREAGYEMVRYADDMVILCGDASSAQQALGLLSEWMVQAGLVLHPQKTRVVDMGQPQTHFDFLGYRFWRGKTSRRIRRFIRPKSVQSFRERLKPLTRRANGQSMKAIIVRLEPLLRGFHGYFKHASARSLEIVDGWVRGRLRGILRKRRHLKGSASGGDQLRWPNHYFASLGLFSLEHARGEELASLRSRVTC